MANKAQICDFLYKVYSDSSVLAVCPSYATRYRKNHCSDQLLIHKACVSYGSASPEMIMLRLC